MVAGFGSECGADDEEECTTNGERTGGDLPAVQRGGLCDELVFQSRDLLFGLDQRVWIVGEETCVSRGKGPKQADEEDEVFHGYWG